MSKEIKNGKGTGRGKPLVIDSDRNNLIFIYLQAIGPVSFHIDKYFQNLNGKKQP